MKISNIIYIICISLLGFFSVNAQTNPDFTITSNDISSEGTELSIFCTITKTGNTLIWNQESNGNSDQTFFNIESVSGSWDIQNNTGDLIYNASVNGYQIIFSLSGDSASGLSASIEMIFPNEENEILNLSVNQLSYL